MNDTKIYDALVVGAGYGGLGAAAQLKRAGLDNFVVLERASRLGGVWRDNTYPGAACDTQAVIYCYTYFPHLSVTRMFSGGQELLSYLDALADEFDLRPHIRFGRTVASATWLEEKNLWHIASEDGDTWLARTFVPAWGQLSEPMVPEFAGLVDYQGAAFHSARWDHSVELAGKRVASVGSAASAVQYVPEVARKAESLIVFQRSANYLLPRNQVHFTDEERGEFRRNPESFERLRREIHELREAGFQRVRHATAEQGTGVAEARAHLEAQVSDPVLRTKLTPDYEYGCKRILRTDDYYPALMRDNVELETSGIARFTQRGIVTADGVEHEVDAVIFGTGFRSQAFQGAMAITGRGGMTLDGRWGNAPEAYLGMAVDGFPNMLLVYGPNTNLNHNSIVTMMEVQHEFIVETVRRVAATPSLVLDVRAEVNREFNDFVQEELEKSSYSSDCSSWYKNADGRVVNNWYGTVEEYRAGVAAIAPSDFGLDSWSDGAAGDRAGSGVLAAQRG